MIQASIPTTTVLQAESEDLLVASIIASALNLQHHSFLTGQQYFGLCSSFRAQLFNIFCGRLEDP
jgi:hypothetical protein